MLVVWGNGAIAISPDFRALFCYGDYFIVIGGLASVIGINLNIYIAEMYLQISSVSGRWCVRLGLAWAITSLSFANAFGGTVTFGSTALAQVVPDNTVGSAVSGVGSEQTITGGTRQGGNLFHSFDRFSVPTNGAAIFNNALDIQNILSRVTGGSISNIDGLIRANGAANLFLLNPNGIVFGQNARLDVGGSFIATTGSSINFADGTQFSATPGTGAPLLTVSVPLGLQFGAGAGEIVNRASGVGLQVGAGKTLGLIGGNVNLEGGRLTARGGRIELGAVAAPGVVGINPDLSGFRFSFPTNLVLGDISLTTDASVSPPRLALVDTRAGGGGSIATNSQNLSLAQGSQMLAGIRSGLGSPDSKAGNIDINATGRIALADGSLITNSVESRAIGDSGDLNVTAGTLELTGGAQLSSNTFAQGNAGNITINASNITFSGVSNGFTSGVLSNVEAGAIGNGGTINIEADSLSLTDGAQIQAILRGASDELGGAEGSGGKVNIDVRNLFNASGSNGRFSSAVSTTVEPGAKGRSGDIDVKAGTLYLSNGAQLRTNTFGTGNAGNIKIDVGGAAIFTGVANDKSGVFSSVENIGVGEGGDISLNSGTLSIADGAQVNATSIGRGDAGNVTIDVNEQIEISGTGPQFASGVFSNVEDNGVGKGGDVRINIRNGSLFLTNGGLISASSTGDQGVAGNVTITASDRVSIDGVRTVRTSNGEETFSSAIFSYVGLPDSQGDLASGNINIKARSLAVTNQGKIEASTFGQGNAGNIQIDVTNSDESASITGSSIIRAASFSAGNAGNITITADGEISLDTNSVIASSVEQIFQETSDRRGGDITIKARSLSIDNGAQMSASTFGTGNAGNIFLRVDDSISLSNSSSIFSAASPDAEGNSGTIDLKAHSLTLTNGGVLSVTNFGQGNAGNIYVDVSDNILFEGVGEFSDGVFASGVYSAIGEQGRGRGGNISLKAKYLSLMDGGIISASAVGRGDGGDIVVDVRTLDLDSGGIFAESTSGNSGDIRLQASKSVRLRNDSLISTSTGSGNGGNITINSPLVIAEFRGNNDIFANAFDGEGGEIKINAQSIFGLKQRTGEELQPELQRRFGTATPTTLQLQEFLGSLADNDVAAISLNNPSFSGNVSFNADYIDPSRDIVELPTGLVDASSLVAAGCPSGAENRFTVAGRGGLPPAPGDKLSSDALLTDWATLQTPETENRAAVATTTPVATNTTPTPPVETITEATSWQYDRNGAIILTSGDTTSPSHLKETLTSCPSS
ncbi:filamentous hemagglutinin N-terminal domain-containing protein [Chroococcidiopsis sp. CCNUC1]|uniref:two-partner secretion domain-containing protein n=1 Tax=Chroococcidiopsis sp. CCNUC1 TaxID=2653189 RepID=UPI0020215F3E|nr:filamentous hemagglutinin N-terminal domain-containing protein [Chroococcidiopsis sp. CCNUC1]URD50894.1 filamentous hemagglutinin N-terminal domain-containing protein [Chroococcidiopsis sp. CCNUC1]